jgi:uncharacterized protein (DUF2141 family)
MRASLIALALGVAAAAAPGVASPQAAAPASLTIDFHGLKTRRGTVLAALFDSKTAYDANARPIRTWTLPADSGDFSVTVAGLKPGDYALKSFHDLDGNGKMNFSPIGYPMEPYAFSNNARGLFGPPAWRAAAFHVDAGANDQSISLH